MKIQLKTLAVASLLAACSISFAADVQMYGSLNAGIKYTKKHDQKASLVMVKGGEEDQSSKWGIRATEQLPNGFGVTAVLEGALNVDDGSTRTFPGSGSNLFSFASYLAVSHGNYEVAFGRMPTLTSPYGAYSAYNKLGVNPTRSALSEIGIGGMTINQFMVDNAVVITTKNRQGLFGTLLYSNGDTDDSAVNQESTYDWTDRRHLMQGMVGWKQGAFGTGLIYTHDMPAATKAGEKLVRKNAADMLHFNMSYDFGPFKLTGTAFYGRNMKNSFSTMATAMGISGKDFGSSNKLLTTKSIYGGVSIPMGPHFVSVSAGYGETEWKGNVTPRLTKETEGSIARVGAIYRYHFSKRTHVYAAGAYLHGKDLLEGNTGNMLSAGMVHKF